MDTSPILLAYKSEEIKPERPRVFIRYRSGIAQQIVPRPHATNSFHGARERHLSLSLPASPRPASPMSGLYTSTGTHKRVKATRAADSGKRGLVVLHLSPSLVVQKAWRSIAATTATTTTTTRRPGRSVLAGGILISRPENLPTPLYRHLFPDRICYGQPGSLPDCTTLPSPALRAAPCTVEAVKLLGEHYRTSFRYCCGSAITLRYRV